MEQASLNVLIIEDSVADARLIEEQLADAHHTRVDLEHKDTLEKGIERLEQGNVDVVLLDLNLGASRGLETLAAVRSAAPTVPIVVLTGIGDDKMGREAVGSGAQDYLIKGDVDSTLLVRSLVYAIERNRTEQNLLESEARLTFLMAQVPAIFWATDRDLCITSMLGRGLEGLHLEQNEMQGKSLYEFLGTDDPSDPAIAMHIEAFEQQTRIAQDVNWSNRWFQAHVEPLRDAGDHVIGTIGVALDITDQRKMVRDIEAAQQIQAHLLPKKAPVLPGFDIAGTCFPAEQCSGDYFDFIPLHDGHLAIVLADATGHGFGPAMLATMVRSYLRAAAMQEKDIHEMLTLVNWLLVRDTPADQFVTMFCCHLDPNSKSFTFTAAGHQGFLIDADDKASQLDSGSLPLGIEVSETFPLSRKILLRPGDILLFPTDGIMEAQSPQGEQFGDRRTLSVVRGNRDQSPSEIIQCLYDCVREFTDSSSLEDDVTAVIIKVEGSDTDTPVLDLAK